MFRWLLRWRKRRANRKAARRLANDLSAFAARMHEFVAELENLNDSAQAALTYAVEEADKSRHVDRKARFVTYRDLLQPSAVRLSESYERLRSTHEMCETLEHALRSRHFDPTTSYRDIIAIRHVVHSLEREESIDEVWLRRVRSIKQ